LAIRNCRGLAFYGSFQLNRNTHSKADQDALKALHLREKLIGLADFS
jgi:hypothetical protein